MQKCRGGILEVEIPGHAVSTNRIWRNNGRGRMYKVEAAYTWERLAIVLIRKAAQSVYGGYRFNLLLGMPMRLEINVVRSTWRGKSKLKRNHYVRPDLSNFIKATEDAVMRAFCLDDSAVVELIAKKVEALGSKKTVIKLTFL